MSLSSPAAPKAASFFGDDRRGLAVALLLAVLVFGRTLAGGFVWDDTKQILQNDYIKESRYLAKAFTADTWAFRNAGGGGPVTHYWRPAFTLWLSANHALFGSSSAAPWHATTLALHLTALAGAWALLRRLGIHGAPLATILAVFAVHPAHVESVAWIIGFPDPLQATALFFGLERALAFWDKRRPASLAAALLCATLALLTKEIGILFLPFLVAVLVLARGALRARSSRRRLWALTAPFGALVVLYLSARAAVLGGLQIRLGHDFGPAEHFSTAPSLLAFYLREALLPFSVSVTHPMRVLPAPTAAATFGPLLALVLAGAALLALARRGGGVSLFGLVLFALPLLPLLNLNALPKDALVQDRYLYVPILGLLTAVVPPLSRVAAGEWVRGLAARAGAAAAVSAMAAGSFVYAGAFRSNASLWRWAASHDPSSPGPWSEHARYLLEDGRREEARTAVDRSLALGPSLNGFLVRARLALAEDRPTAALDDLRRALEIDGANQTAYELLAMSYERMGKLGDAERVLRLARDRLPSARCALTDNLAAALHRQGRADEELAELESVRPLVRDEVGALGKGVLFHLGLAYEARGRAEEARAAFQDYLQATRHEEDDTSRYRRRRTGEELTRLEAPAAPARTSSH